MKVRFPTTNYLVIAIILVAMTVSSCSVIPKKFRPVKQAPEPTPTIVPAGAFIDVPYANDPDAKPHTLSLDVYPASQSNSPVIVYVHSGGWTWGDKSSVGLKPSVFNSRGYVFVSVNHRLIPDVALADQVSDVARAIAWTIANISKYNGDPTSIYLMGHSSGGYLVSIVATDDSYLKAAGSDLHNLKGVIALGVETFDIPGLLDDMPETEGQTYRLAFGQDRAFWQTMSPISYVKAGKGIPPFFIAYTTEAETHPALTLLFESRLSESGIPNFVYAETARNHFQIDDEFGTPGDALTESVFRWLKDNE